MPSTTQSLLTHFPPMGVYETLFKFLDATGVYMGSEGTHPWAQGFPLTSPLPGGPEIPTSVDFSYVDLKYPQATGEPPMLAAIRDYYNHFYGASIETSNVAVFAGGRPGIYATLAFLEPSMRVLIEETEYTPYWDALRLLNRAYSVIPSNASNRFRPTLDDYRAVGPGFVVKSNPCNPTGVTWTGDELRSLVEQCQQPGWAGLIDEAYEFFHEPSPESALRYVKDINETNLFVVSAATKGLQAPGLRIGWVVASKENIEIFRNFSSIAMGGVARPSQILATKMLALDRVDLARKAVGRFFGEQRRRYGDALDKLGFELFTGDGGFYHWGRLPDGMSADEFNQRLFAHKAAILPGRLCDMNREAGAASPLDTFMRFSFGPLKAESFEGDVEIISEALGR
jgi:aminotransferase